MILNITINTEKREVEMEDKGDIFCSTYFDVNFHSMTLQNLINDAIEMSKNDENEDF